MLAIPDITRHFQALCAQVPLLPISSEAEYDRAVASLNDLLDAGAADESHPLAPLAQWLGDLIAAYEAAHYALPPGDGRSVLVFLMEQHGLTQSDLPEIGSQGVVSEVINGKRALNVRQVKALARRFSVSPAVFFQK